MKYSPYSQSLDDDLFPKKKPRRDPGLWKWLLAIGFVLFFVYRSTLPVERLQSEPPPEFIDHNPDRRQRRGQPERRVAQAYWEVAVHSIQLKYSPKRSLPADPPPEFKIDSKVTRLSENMDANRAFYWRRLRGLWTHPEIWQVTYGWNTGWVTDFLTDLEQYASQSLEQFVRSVQFWREELGVTRVS